MFHNVTAFNQEINQWNISDKRTILMLKRTKVENVFTEIVFDINKGKPIMV